MSWKNISTTNMKLDKVSIPVFKMSSQLENCQSQAALIMVRVSLQLQCLIVKMGELHPEVEQWRRHKVNRGLHKYKRISLQRSKESQSLISLRILLQRHLLLIIIYNTFRKRRIMPIKNGAVKITRRHSNLLKKQHHALWKSLKLLQMIKNSMLLWKVNFFRWWDLLRNVKFWSIKPTKNRHNS